MAHGPNLITYNEMIQEEPQATILALFLAIISCFPELPVSLPLGPQTHSSLRLMPLPGMPSLPVDNAERGSFSARVALTHPAPNLG